MNFSKKKKKKKKKKNNVIPEKYRNCFYIEYLLNGIF